MLQVIVLTTLFILLIASHILKERFRKTVFLIFSVVILASSGYLLFSLNDRNLAIGAGTTGVLLGIISFVGERYSFPLKKILTVWMIFLFGFISYFQIFYVPSIFGNGVYINLSVLNNFRRNTYWGLGIDARNRYGETKLYVASIKNDINELKRLISEGGDVNAVTKFGDTPIGFAVVTGKLATVKILIENGASLSGAKENGLSPLHYVAMRGTILNDESIKIAKYLLKKGVNINIKDNIGRTPLHFAVHNTRIVRTNTKPALKSETIMTEFLIDNGADLDLVTNTGDTPLHSAAYTRRYEAVRYLIEQGADTTIKNSKGLTPFDVVQLPIPYGKESDQRLEDKNKIVKLLTPLTIK